MSASPLFALACAVAALGADAAMAQGAPVSSDPELRVTVSVDLAGLPESIARRIDALNLESRVVQRLLQEGFAVVAPFARPHVLLRAEEVDGSVKLVAQTGQSYDEVTVSLAGGTRAELQLEISQKLVDLARIGAQAVAEAFAAASKAEEPRERPRAVIIPQVPPPPKREYSATELSAGVDALWRGALDPLFRVGLSLSGESIVGVAFAGGFAPSQGPGITVQEWQVVAGPRFRLLAANELSAHASLMAGVVAHHWSAPDAVENPSGDKVDVLVVAPVEVQWQPREWLGLGLRVAPGYDGWTREHLIEGNLAWRREAARLEAGATIAIKL
jgi:hypothetical protein